MAVLAELLHAPLTQIFLRQNITKLAKNLLKKLNLKKKNAKFLFFFTNKFAKDKQTKIFSSRPMHRQATFHNCKISY